jgi:hypothetical protein
VMIVKKGKLVVHREAPELKPEPWGKPFVAALARSLVAGLVPQRELDAAKQVSEDAIAQRVAAAVAADRERRGGPDAVLAKLQAQVAAFEAAAGVSISDPWDNAKNIGHAVALVRFLLDDAGRLSAFKGHLGGLEHALRQLHDLHNALANAAQEGAPA